MEPQINISPERWKKASAGFPGIDRFTEQGGDLKDLVEDFRWKVYSFSTVDRNF